MAKRVMGRILLGTAILASSLISVVKTNNIAYAEPSALAEPEMLNVDITWYADEGQTATGTNTMEGRTCAFSPQYYGYTACVYDDQMNFIGYYIVEDTGAVWSGVRTGKTLDIFCANEDECFAKGRIKNAYVQLIKAEG